ncbi:MAG: amidohydrolase family protein [Caldilineaceae bacterium SB0664_bin_27]|uniref:Amidohydrolase family protein n=1 Tax=Caldilineaceae bacterium SB0664_bin_27 TaxID=2605260 RepID=A0A6B0YNS1_9CHLR|nr:amidohydrolase family protein [Caldilineaceae bacterium SB0664_bin_27]
MTTLRLPGLVDAHVHLREPGYTQKEDFHTGTRAALAGGVTTVLDMPNTVPPTSTPANFQEKVRLAEAKSVCDVGLFVGATVADVDAYLPVAPQSCGLKIYVNETFGSLRIEELGLLHRLFRTWARRADELDGWRQCPPEAGNGRDNEMLASASTLGPVAVHAEELMVPVCLTLSNLYNLPLHIVHVSRRSEIELIRAAKEEGIPVTCEATPHHLFLTSEDYDRGGNRFDMRPKLAAPDDVAALWENLDIIDIFASDHAPHTFSEKGMRPPGETVEEGEQGGNTHSPMPGVPGVETMLPLLLTAVDAGQLELDDLLLRCVENPRRIYGLAEQPQTWVEVDVDKVYELDDADMRTRCGWTPFDGRQVKGRVEKVVLRGETVFDGERVLAAPGSGRVLFQESGK